MDSRLPIHAAKVDVARARTVSSVNDGGDQRTRVGFACICAMTHAGTVTLMITDLLNSTELLIRAGDESAQRIFEADHKSLFDAVVAHGGHEVRWPRQWAGGGFPFDGRGGPMCDTRVSLLASGSPTGRAYCRHSNLSPRSRKQSRKSKSEPARPTEKGPGRRHEPTSQP